MPNQHDRDKPFVGREDELERWKQVLADPAGQAVLVSGPAGFGKSTLLQRMAAIAETHPDMNCAHVRYEVIPTDSPESTMTTMLDEAWEAAKIEQRSLDATPRRLKQWRALLKVFKIDDLVFSLRRDLTRPTRDQLRNTLELISSRLDENARLVFFLDPEELIHRDSADVWRIVTRDLPDKVKLVFAQRPEDQLISSAAYLRLENVIRIPASSLSTLTKHEIEKIILARQTELDCPVGEVQTAISRYHGHPYAVQAALDLIASDTPLDDLPNDPPGIAKEQWKQAYKIGGDKAWQIMTAYAVLSVAVTDSLVASVAEVRRDDLRIFRNDAFLGGLLREEPEGWRLYHMLLQDFRMDELGHEEANVYHRRAIVAYRRRLNTEDKPDALAATRLPYHILETGDEKAFITCLLDECSRPLLILGRYYEWLDLLDKARPLAESGTQQKADLLHHIGLIHHKHGVYHTAREVLRSALKIDKSLNNKPGMSSAYRRLGLVYHAQGQPDKAEEMHRASLAIERHLNNEEGVARQLNNLGLICRKQNKLDDAEDHHQEALQINLALHRLEGIAKQYTNLGLIFWKKGDLVNAETMYMKSLETNERLGRREGMAKLYGNLGLIHQTRGKLEMAEEMHIKALEIQKQLGRSEGMARQYANLGLIHQSRRELHKAQTMFRKALKIHKQLGRLEGMANQYANLGHLAEQQGDVTEAQNYWEKSRDLFNQMGIPHKVERVQGRLDELSEMDDE